ncbi:leucine-rich protein [Trypanosoma rangeli]|uniref:Leucine-rich protein n=1 Tax=Trypanosoma rangeli TaxID=5698 RepID=A0A3R7LWJ9_TRYRA|nr:leucine-rich protein [Trypanosoma rangeli]RNF04742.1 leucine-rich protein [Trypanosoma rangeli]|eukprot:RNF04742.1 leucine-rich protein [Trypanosoma rangeli]
MCLRLASVVCDRLCSLFGVGVSALRYGVEVSAMMKVKRVTQRSEFHFVRVRECQREVDILLSGLPPEQRQKRQVQESYFVPKLVTLCVEVIAANFAALPEADGLRDEHPKLYDDIIERLPTDLPLTVSVPRILSDEYWRRCCEARWSLGQLSDRTFGKLLPPRCEGWKQSFLERVLSDFLTALRSPEMTATEQEELENLCLVCRGYVRTLDLACQVTRFALYDCLLSRMPHLEDIRLTIGVNNVGTDFEWGMMGFGESDAFNVRRALINYAPLRYLRLPNNRLNSSLLKGILGGLVHNTSIAVLDFSSNRIDDEGARQLALLLCKDDLPLEELYLHDNQIRADGAVALGESLTMNKTLRVLNLRLNRIPDEAGGVAIVNGLAAHPALEVLDLSHNMLGDATARALAEALPLQTSLRSLNVAGNKALGVDTSELLLQGVVGNTTLCFFDARGCGVEKSCMKAMEDKVQDIVRAIRKQELEAKEELQRQKIRQEVDAKLAKTFSV